ncbi:hypothetical protein ACN2MM_09520 [Alkalilimnicola ehrlichii MLHE-1]|uniref:T4 bacteriophage base plate protein n=1 Tax=Alkalilimnicola ehrlichii (strain ATCC BAA-1101 / DSM 17681 / MLHE-1) TaxID=187272 RepID=Q0A7T5_ALKEH|nr:hypothetical protein [Alkalilimnicola ehrlichii]ABI57102.1 conserved hypothetical protein [Alkalilimnicola ehrlichii MLHE-1]
MERLPGGLLEAGERRRDFRFKPVDGALEMALLEAARTAPSTPAAVTAVLATALEALAGGPASTERVRRLCVADRQHLMRALAVHFGERHAWMSARCAGCGEAFDFQLDLACLPTDPAGPTFPEVAVDWQGRNWRFRLPNGADQESLAEAGDVEALLQRCLLAPSGADVAELGEAGHEAVDRAMDAVSPGVVSQAQAPCPHCEHDNRVVLNPYSLLGRAPDSLLAQVHNLATHYHWSEREILDLPRERREAYLRLIDRARGMTQ